MTRPLLLLIAAPVALIACAQVLSYDDYRARPSDAGPVVDSSDAVDTIVADTGPGRSQPPTRPAGEPKPSGKGRTLWIAAKHIYIGGQTSLGVASAEAWKEWGFDLDNVCTTLDDSIKNVGTCRRPLEAKQDFLVDGFDCRDNNFGHHVVALLNLTSEGFEQRVNEGIFEGTSTWIIRIDDLDDGTDDPYAPAKLYRASADKAVKWDGTDVRKIVAESVVGGDLEKSISEFKKGFVRDNVWVSGEPEQRDLLLPGSTAVVITLPLDASVFTVKLNADHRGGSRGVVAGAVPVAAIETLIRPIATESGFCPGTSLYNSLVRTVQRFPDVVVGAPGLQNTAVECDGISLGMGFDVVPVQPVTQVVPGDPPGKNLCDAGVDGG